MDCMIQIKKENREKRKIRVKEGERDNWISCKGSVVGVFSSILKELAMKDIKIMSQQKKRRTKAKREIYNRWKTGLEELKKDLEEYFYTHRKNL